MRSEKLNILCVDDEPEILQGLKLHLRKKFQVFTATGGNQGLEMLAKNDSFAIVLSDMRMPNMNGAKFLSKVHDKYPNIVRMLLTGYSEIGAAIDAINEGQVFRFLTKPCPPQHLLSAFQAATDQYKLIHAEKELLEKTLKGSVKLLTDILSMTDPDAFGHLISLSKTASKVAKELNLDNIWEVELAVMLSQIGSISIPPEIKEKDKDKLTKAEQAALASIPDIGKRLLINIPRLEEISNYIYYQNKNYDGTGFPNDKVSGENIPIVSRILKVVFDLDNCMNRAKNFREALKELFKTSQLYDPKVLELVRNLVTSSFGGVEVINITANKLKIGDRLVSDIVTNSGRLLLSAGNRVSNASFERLKQYILLVGIKEPLQVERSERKERRK